MNEQIWKIVFCAIVLFGIGILGFYLGRKTIKPVEKVVTEYVKGDTVYDSIPYPVPYKVVAPIDTADVIRQCVKDGVYVELFPERIVTETKYIEVTKADTAAVLKDWATKRYYSEVLFDSDTMGNCKFNAEVQYNRLNVVGYEFTPVIKTVTTTKYTTRVFSPFLGGGFMINPWDDVRDPMVVGSVGFFVKERYGIQLQYQHGFQSKNDFIGGSLLYKF